MASGNGFARSPADVQRMFDAVVAYLNTDRPIRYRLEVLDLREAQGAKRSSTLEVQVGGFDPASRSPKTLVKFVEPKNLRGRLFLYESARLWVYFPNTGQPLRIPPQEQLFSDADVGAILDIDLRKYYKPVEPDPSLGTNVLTLMATTRQAPYGRLVFHFDDARFPSRAEYYTPSGKMLKRAEFSQHSQTGGKRYFKEVRIFPAVQTGSTAGTLIRYASIEFRDIPAVHYSPEYLKNIR